MYPGVDTVGWQKACRIHNSDPIDDDDGALCRLGIPWPKNPNITISRDDCAYDEAANKQSWIYNCYVNDKVENYFVPRLENSLLKQKTPQRY